MYDPICGVCFLVVDFILWRIKMIKINSLKLEKFKQKNKNIVLIDLRSPVEYNKIKTIGINIPATQFVKKMQALCKKDDIIIVYNNSTQILDEDLNLISTYAENLGISLFWMNFEDVKTLAQ